MAKRKAASARGRKYAGKRAGGRRSRGVSTTRARSSKRAAGPAGARKARKATRSARKASARKSSGKSPKRAVRQSGRKGPALRKAVARKTRAPRTIVARKAPALDRVRKTVQDEDIVPTPPSSLDMDRHASAARTGRRGMQDRIGEHTETSPALTGGDVDADWESAYSVGDEAPGGDNPTPDQEVVDDIGRAVGVEYEDNEELKSEEKIAKRDRHRWELDPASSEDYNDR
jgi:hypothetical protein